MSATDVLFSFFPSLCNKNISKKDCQLLELFLFIFLFQELRLDYINKNQNQFEENFMICGTVIKALVNDLLTNNDYSVKGLASYTGYPEEVIYDLASGVNSDPTFRLSTKIIELHAIARRDFYKELLQKVLQKCEHENI